MNSNPQRREKNGLIDPKIALHDLEVLKLNPLCERLNVGRVQPVLVKNLAMMLVEVQNFMEINFGCHSPKPREFVKLPFSLFHDYNVHGSTELILREILACTEKNEWSSFDLTSSNVAKERRVAGLQLLRKLEMLMLQNGALKRPRVFFPSSIDSSDMQRFTEIVLLHGGSVAKSPESASHVLELDPEVELLPALVNDFIQPLDIRLDIGGTGTALVHWWYYPSCYDEIVSSLEVATREPPECNPAVPPVGVNPAVGVGVWRVNYRFIRDLEVFNEWGNEADYLVEDHVDVSMAVASPKKNLSSSAAPLVEDLSSGQAKKKSKKRKADAAAEAPAAPVDEDLAVQVPVISRGGVKPGDAFPVVGAVPGTTDKVFVDYAVAPIIPKSWGFSGAVDMAYHKGSVLIVHSVSDMGVEVVEMQQQLSTTSPNSAGREKVLDATAGPPAWYSSSVVGEPELRFLAVMFSPSPSVNLLSKYIRIREHLVVTYAASPAAYLTATEARHRLAADAAFVCRVHEFLDAERVINWAVLPENIPSPALCLPLVQKPTKLSSASSAYVSEPDAKKDNDMETIWNPAWDTLLLMQLQASCPLLESFADLDWVSIATAVSAQIDTSAAGGVSAAQCMARFAGMGQQQILSGGQGDRSMAHCPARIAALRSRLASGRLSALSAHIIENAGPSVSSLATRAVKSSLNSADAVCVTSHAAAVQGREELNYTLDFLSARIQAAAKVERALAAERSRIEVDRKDALILKARVAAFTEYRQS